MGVVMSFVQYVVKTGPVNLKGTAQTKATSGDGGGNAGKLNLLAQGRGALFDAHRA